MRLRLVIPAAIAAAATYAALVRDERAAEPSNAVRTPSSQPAPATPRATVVAHTVVPDRPAPPAPPPVVASVTAPPAEVPSQPVAADPPAPHIESQAPPPPASAPVSQFEDLAPSAHGAPSQPSVYDLLAGTPKAEAEAPPSEPAVPTHVPEDAIPASPADPWNIPLDEGRFALGGWAASSGHTMVSAVTFRKRLAHDVAPDRIVLDVDASDNVPEGGLMVLSEPGFAPDRDGFTLLLAAAEPGPFSAAGSYRVLPLQ